MRSIVERLRLVGTIRLRVVVRRGATPPASVSRYPDQCWIDATDAVETLRNREIPDADTRFVDSAVVVESLRK